jgi:putative component of toxin-antitoxin plasmid stabilization module
MRFLHVATEAALTSFEAFRQVRERMSRVTFADMDREIGVFGDPAYCVERICALREEYGFDEFIGYFNQGGVLTRACCLNYPPVGNISDTGCIEE